MIADTKKETINPAAGFSIDKDAEVVSDGARSHADFPKMFSQYIGRAITPEEIGRVLPWVHIAISNAKSLLRNIYHGIKPECLEQLRQAMDKSNMSARAYDRILKVARTIADLEGTITVRTHHIMEAISYRNLDRSSYFNF